jgi:N-acetylglucosamine-6-phosphate deacetylase
MSDAIKGNILTSAGWVRGEIQFNERIASISGSSVDPSQNEDDYILPGFIDLHVHGGGGKDMMEGGDAVHTIAAMHARHGTTSMLATTMTAPPEDIDLALKGIGAAVVKRGKGEARVLGAHLEGPYINSGKLGAQPPFARSAKLADVEKLEQLAPLR